METLTKLWNYNQNSDKKQRDISLMKEHRQRYGTSGNCFDLAIWLLDEFKHDGIEAYPIGHGLKTEDAHVAVIALDESGNRYLCDLGDQWIKPILVERDHEDYTNEKLSGFFPAADVRLRCDKDSLEVLYHRPNGSVSSQTYDIRPIETDYFLHAAEHSQNLIKPIPLLECRVPYNSEIAHWEFGNWQSFLSTTVGLYKEKKAGSLDEWVERVNLRCGYDKDLLYKILYQYMKYL
ncbi:hypothetical protein ACFO3D_13525 [Virgibacillus kekensis]|uniref:N-acetyltransferase n=1 Tax=Virgibacillus kekensis TaxID=202261 RepID=A0ABV9DNS5_9BACI